MTHLSSSAATVPATADAAASEADVARLTDAKLLALLDREEGVLEAGCSCHALKGIIAKHAKQQISPISAKLLRQSAC